RRSAATSARFTSTMSARMPEEILAFRFTFGYTAFRLFFGSRVRTGTTGGLAGITGRARTERLRDAVDETSEGDSRLPRAVSRRVWVPAELRRDRAEFRLHVAGDGA